MPAMSAYQRTAQKHSAAVLGPNLGLALGFGHRPGAPTWNSRRDAAITRRRGRLRYGT